MNPGELREPVAFYSLIKTKTASLATTVTKQLAFKTFAKITDDKPVRAIEGDQLRSVQTRTVVIRYAKNRTPEIDMLMKWNGHTYQVVSIGEPDTLKMYIPLTVSRS